MQQLSGLDAAFVHQDTRRTPMHISAVLIYNSGPSGRARISTAFLQQVVAQRLRAFPLFRRKLRQVPMGMDTPYWVDVTEPQWRQHISESTLAGKGDWNALYRLLAQLHSERMDLAAPLWHMQLVNGLYDLPGLPEHCQALVLKIHHSAIDGVAMSAIIGAMHEKNNNPPAPIAARRSAPQQWQMWARANLNNLDRQVKFAETLGKLLPGVARARRSRRQFDDLPPVHSTACRFNASVAPGRNIGVILIPMREVVAIRRAVRRVTLNDIAMTCVAGGMRAYLRKHGQLPDASLAAGVPINLRSSHDELATGNKIATMIVGLATDIADPVERLRTVHRYAVTGKKQINALGSGTIMDISDSLTPGILAGGLRSLARASQFVKMPVPFHTMISNVPGPADTLRLGRAELVVPFGLGPVRDNMGLFHIVSSSPTLMSLSFSACAKLLPDGGFYRRCLLDAYTALRDSAIRASDTDPTG